MTTSTPSTAFSASGTTGSPAASVVPHLSVAERVARGKAARAEVPRSSHAVFEPSSRPQRLGRVARASGRDARPRARSDPIRPNAGLAVYLLPRGGEDHGPRSRTDASLGAACPVLRRCAPVELRGVRLARTPARVRHQRLRRDAPRAMGVGRQASGGEHAGRRARQRLSNQGPGADRARHGRAIQDGDEGVRRHEGPRGLVLQARNRDRPADLAPRFNRKMVERTQRALAKAHTKDSMAAFSKLTRVGRWRGADRRSVAADRATRAARAGSSSARSCSSGFTR